MGNQFALHFQRKPILNHIVYNQIKDGGKDDTSLGFPPIRLEVGSVVPILWVTTSCLQKISQETVHM